MTATIINLSEARFALQAAEVMTLTAEAYSRPVYGDVEWAKCAAMLLGMGHSPGMAADLLMSRVSRFAHEYEGATAEDFARFLASPAGLKALEYELAA